MEGNDEENGEGEEVDSDVRVSEGVDNDGVVGSEGGGSEGERSDVDHGDVSPAPAWISNGHAETPTSDGEISVAQLTVQQDSPLVCVDVVRLV